ncbi:rRNA pseudouridine synthase [Paracoccaceae bacterium]|nr:rRNA pseudouridine synthase [Paracoccaceae bacterium]
MSIKSEIRISRYLAKAGLASRREAEKLILDGRVTLNGNTVSEPWRNCTTTDILKLDGTIVSQSMSTVLYQLHKPRGYLSTSKDEMGRKTIFDLVDSELNHLMIVGRLDYYSEGLMILTNNGELKRYLELPKNNVERIYKVKIRGHLTSSNLSNINRGLSLDGLNYKPMSARVLESNGFNSWIEMVLTEGKNREIRKILASFNLSVVRLIRRRFGPFNLDNLKTGKSKKLKLEHYPALKNYWS